MKKIILVSVIGIFMSACATMQNYKQEDSIPQGFKFKYGPLTKVQVGDKVIAYEKVSSISRRGYSYKEVGELTIVQIDPDYAIMQKDSEFLIGSATAFLKK